MHSTADFEMLLAQPFPTLEIHAPSFFNSSWRYNSSKLQCHFGRLLLHLLRAITALSPCF